MDSFENDCLFISTRCYSVFDSTTVTKKEEDKSSLYAQFHERQVTFLKAEEKQQENIYNGSLPFVPRWKNISRAKTVLQ